eukprot:352712-Chlamydomonas_euryale.AAC.12
MRRAIGVGRGGGGAARWGVALRSPRIREREGRAFKSSHVCVTRVGVLTPREVRRNWRMA